MKKKTYAQPACKTVKLTATCGMLAASPFRVSDDTTSHQASKKENHPDAWEDEDWRDDGLWSGKYHFNIWEK